MNIFKFKSAFYLFIFSLFFLSFTNSNAQPLSSQLYFCEQYKDGIEIGVSSTFTTGRITVMLDLRPVNKTVGVNKVFIKITKVADKNGYYPDEVYIDRIPFDVGPDWDYIYFEDHERIQFIEPGVYRVYCLNDNGEIISSAFLKVVS
jgi:hypothetical protein